MSSGQVRGWIWRRMFPSTPGQVAQFQCRLFLLVQALIFGDHAGILVRYFVLLLVCLVVFVGSSLVKWVPIPVRFGTLGGKSVVMASLPGLVSRPRTGAVWLSFWFCCCVVGWELPLRYCSGKFA